MPAPTIEISGTWQMVRAEFDGETAPDEVAQRTEIEFTTTRYIVRFAGKPTDQGTIDFSNIAELVSLEPPQALVGALTLHGTSGLNAARSIPCIYQRAGNRLRICFGIGGVLPTEFSTRMGQQRYLATYRLI